MRKKITSIFLSTTIFLLSANSIFAQEEQKEKSKIIFKDTLDNYFDLSDFIINKKGFIPIPVIITEPSLGGFGGGLAPVFIQPNKPRNLNGRMIPMPPDITTAFGGGTLNGSWFLGGGRTGSISKWGIRYTIGAAYGNVNMDYYFNIDKLNKEVESEFNIRTIPAFLSVTKQLRDPRFNVGLEYLFMHNKLEVKNPAAGPLQEKIDSLVSDYISGNIGKLGIKASYDNRDNTFTPNKGLKVNITADWSHPAFGSDYKYGQFEGAAYYYIPLSHNLITGTRFDMQQVAGDIPFYIKPFVDMRGVPSARYQGKTTMLIELEERWDFQRRWSLVGFGGVGKGFDKFSDFGSAEWAWGYGAGFRYLMARLLNIRMGVDFAMGPDGFTYYIVFGTSWIRQ
ncbi:MAG: outer membrane protein assembly factor [Tannerella sp.]|nr:outer membrane protein assembly factor [Tannerella sp.]